MSKIITAINVMISNLKKVSKITPDEEELFFLYDNKHKWSITKEEDNYLLYYYPGDETIEQLASMPTDEWDDTKYITYSSEEIKTREAYESMQALYRTVKEKALGIEDALDDIINSDTSDIPS